MGGILHEENDLNECGEGREIVRRMRRIRRGRSSQLEWRRLRGQKVEYRFSGGNYIH